MEPDERHFKQYGRPIVTGLPPEDMDPVQLPALTCKSIALFGAVAPRCYITDGILAKDPFNMTQITLLK